MMGAAPVPAVAQLGRYELHGAIARGGMATVYIARMSGAAGFARTVAIKRLHPHLAADPTFASMFVDEARLAARIRHPNVIDTLDVVNEAGELFLVMDFVLGETLAKLVKGAASQSLFIPPPVVSSILIGALEGLHAAHEATDERGMPLGIVHRDISPQNIMVAQNGVARVLDFGVAKAAGRMQETEGGELKGKLAYMAPEQLTRAVVDRRTDVFAMGVVLWEALTSRRLFAGEDAASTLYAILNEPIVPPSQIVPGLLPAVDDVVQRALERDPENRFATARDMALALEAACLPSPARHAGKWVEELAGPALKTRADVVRAVENAQPVSPHALHGEDGPHSGSHSHRIGTGVGAPESWRQGSPQQMGYSTVGSGVRELSQVSMPSQVSLPSQLSMPSQVSMTGPQLPSPAGAPAPAYPANHPGAGQRSGLAVKREAIGFLVGAGVFVAVLLAFGLVIGIRTLTKKPQVSEPTLEPTSVTMPPSTAVTAPPPVDTAPPGAAVTAPPPVDTAPPGAAVTAPATGEPAPTTAPAATGPAATAPAATTSAHVVPKPVVKPPPKPAKDCSDPFTVGPDGVKRPKPECFGH